MLFKPCIVLVEIERLCTSALLSCQSPNALKVTIALHVVLHFTMMSRYPTDIIRSVYLNMLDRVMIMLEYMSCRGKGTILSSKSNRLLIFDY